MDSSGPNGMILTWTPNGTNDDNLQMTAVIADEGVYLRIVTPTGQASAQVCNWTDVVQAIIDSDPDLFGVRDEPLHRGFIEGMESMGFSVPRWPGGASRSQR